MAGALDTLVEIGTEVDVHRQRQDQVICVFGPRPAPESSSSAGRESGMGVGGIPYTMEDMQIRKLVVIRSNEL